MSNSDSESEYELSLSLDTLKALQDFKLEEEERIKEFEKLEKAAEEDYELTKEKRQKGMDLFKEDWQLSQFWYSNETAETLARALLEGADKDTHIAIVSAPSVYAAIKKIELQEELPTEHIFLFEYDKRFEVMAGKEHFVFYDFADPENFRDDIKGTIDRLLIDPPFLNENCQTKSSVTAHSLLKHDLKSSSKSLLTNHDVEKHRLISCTGERMKDIMKQVYNGIQITDFLPEHANGLSNEFRCYADFECSQWKFSKD
ncbi:probable N(6)-adenine-specific DNA methyltransferase-like 1 [Hanseniaspora guilliermondii]|uniref:Protein-lysine N-methyltransferase EFM5 n=1 Tax=Hanseniaspora guilliermondii TaxID=56406 RepID=A0A1L0FHU1_9ASCO|nr:probable N(6)-adenine-specific DNA methyltransferase-like 1 [Hanseniaspora guilliermondii]